MKTVYRILTPILSLLIPPALFFLPLFRIMITSGLSKGETKTNLLTSLTGLGEYVSLFDVFKTANGSSATLNTFKGIWSALSDDAKAKMTEQMNIPALVLFLIFFALLVLLVVLLAVFSAASKKRRLPLALSIGAIVSALAMNASFNAFAKPFISGRVNLNSLLGNTNATLGLLLGNVASVDYLKLAIAYSAALLLLTIILIIGICTMVEDSYSK